MATTAAGRSLNSLQLVADPQLWMDGFYRDVVDGAQRSKTTVGPGWKMSDPAQIARGAPQLGEHNEYVLGEILGLSPQEQAALKERGVTR